MANDTTMTVTPLAAGAAAASTTGGFVLPSNFDLCQNACLIRVTVSAWSAREKSPEAGRNAAQAGGADEDYVDSYIRHVAKDHPLKKAVDQKANEVRNWIKDNLSFWNTGVRLCTNLQYDSVMKELRKMKAEFMQTVDDFFVGLPQMEAMAAVKQGTYSGKFPAKSVLEERFAFEIEVSAIADPNDIRLKHVSASVAKEIEECTRSSQAKQVTEVMTRLATKVEATIQNFIGQMGKPKQGYHKTAVENVLELAELIPQLNLTADPEINAIARKIGESFADVSVQELKEDPELREEVTKEATSLLERIKKMKPTGKI